jgi:F420-dependent oxidoreductase-like protein
MRFSVWPSLLQPWPDVLEVARHAEATGWDGVYVADHFMGNAGGIDPVSSPVLEATAVLSALASATERLRIGPMVFGATYRHPAVLANWAATVDRISGGRLVLGIGAGWQINEHEQYGIELPPVRQLVDRFGEYCEVLHGLLRTDKTTFEGDWFHLQDALCEPKPVQEPLPVLIGAKGDRMLGLVARYADEWNTGGLPDEVAERAAFLDRRCEAIGRDPATIVRSTQVPMLITDDENEARRAVASIAPRVAVAGTVDQITELVAGWSDAGFDEVILLDLLLGEGQQRLDAMDQFLESVAPSFR